MHSEELDIAKDILESAAYSCGGTRKYAMLLAIELSDNVNVPLLQKHLLDLQPVLEFEGIKDGPGSYITPNPMTAPEILRIGTLKENSERGNRVLCLMFDGDEIHPEAEESWNTQADETYRKDKP